MGSILAKPHHELVALRPLGGLINLARPGGAAANEDAAPALRRCSIPADGGHRRLENSIRWPPIRPNQSTDNGGQEKKKGKAGQQRDRRITSRKSAWPLRMKSWLSSAARGYKVVKIEIVRANDGP